ncbi:MAG: glycosyltransferase family 39 protein [Bdellovibrionaceae bacterium]|nr:glycosyltransferase family 39 protein [Pseudobdellovibrionaceae bacterium]
MLTNVPKDPFLKRCLGLSLALHLLAVVFSVGFEQADEFFQIHEFAAYKMGKISGEDLPWEFGERMRSWAQPAVLYGLSRGMSALGLERPSSWAFAFRLLSALIGWASLVGLTLVSRPWFSSEPSYRGAVLLSSVFWCLPYLQARTSSENWGGSLFFIGLAVGFRAFTGRRTGPWLLAGAFWGAAYLCRYQVGLLIAGAVFWMAYFKRDRRVFWLVPGFFALGALGILADRWGYGAWTLSQWNYLRVNLIEGKAAADFGAAPWTYYLHHSLLKVPPMGGLCLLVLVGGWSVARMNPLTWSTLPFVLVHQMLSHKELRFLYPVVPCLPFFAGLLYEWGLKKRQKLSRFAFRTFLVFNVVYLPLGVFVAANRWEHFYGAVDRYIGAPVHLYSLNPFPYVGRFFTFSDLRFSHLDSWTELPTQSNGTRLLLTQGYRSPLAEEKCERVFASLPEWWTNFNFSFPPLNWLPRTTIWSLHRCP